MLLVDLIAKTDPSDHARVCECPTRNDQMLTGARV